MKTTKTTQKKKTERHHQQQQNGNYKRCTLKNKKQKRRTHASSLSAVYFAHPQSEHNVKSQQSSSLTFHMYIRRRECNVNIVLSLS